MLKQGRNALMVAKSVAVIPNSQNQYNWLFNEEEETPRITVHMDSLQRSIIDSSHKMVSNQEANNRTHRSNNSKTGITSQNFPVTNNYLQTKNGISREMDFNENLTESIQSDREVTDEFLLNRQKTQNGRFQGREVPQRDSIMQKSLQNVKNMFKKAAEGLKTSQIEVFGEAVTSAKNNIRQSKILTEVNHEMVEIELDEIDQSKLRGTSKNQFTGSRTVYERQLHDQTVFSDLKGQNPLDEDSN